MTAALIEIKPIRTAATDEIDFIDDLETFGTDAAPGCGDDNPYQ